MRSVYFLLVLSISHPIFCLMGGSDTGYIGGAGNAAVLIFNGDQWITVDQTDHFCTGILVSELIVLTNGACYSELIPSKWTLVISGSRTPFESGMFHYVIDHKKIGTPKKHTPYYSLAILLLDHRIVIDAYTMPILLPTKDDHVGGEGQSYRVYGFGCATTEPPKDLRPGTSRLQLIYNPSPYLNVLENVRYQRREVCDSNQVAITDELKVLCFGDMKNISRRLSWGDNGAPLIGSKDFVLYGIACYNQHFEWDGDRLQALYYVDIKAYLGEILSAMKALMHDNAFRNL